MLQTIQKHRFLLEELVKRDFDRKYKGALLGAAWSVMNPLLTLLIMRVVFGYFFGGAIEHYTIYLFCGTVVFSFFSESASEGLMALVGNAHIFTRVNVPKYLFLLAKNAQTFINFLLTLLVFFLFCALDGVAFSWRFLLLLYPVGMLLLFNLGMGFILSALYVFFRDVQYLWGVVTQLLLYLSAVFYSVDSFPARVQSLFLINPLYLFIRYFRTIVLDGTIPSALFHLLMAFDALAVLALGIWIYKKFDTEFLYYV
ncbi:MAG: ABC transporter permease [Oscillospiraceae bacterium]|nr:ABC transporter permease [Oscillospiraceae bacterium]